MSKITIEIPSGVKPRDLREFVELLKMEEVESWYYGPLLGMYRNIALAFEEEASFREKLKGSKAKLLR